MHSKIKSSGITPEHVIDLFCAHYTYREVAALYELPMGTVYDFCRKHKIASMDYRQACLPFDFFNATFDEIEEWLYCNQKFTTKELAVAAGVSVSTIRNHLHTLRRLQQRHLSREEVDADERRAKLLADDYRNQHHSDHLGCPMFTANRLLMGKL